MNEVEVKKRRGTEIDLTDSERLQRLASVLGGEEHMSQEYPEVYKLFKNTQGYRVRRGLDDKDQGYKNSAFLMDVIYDKAEKCAYAAGQAYLTKKVPLLIGCLFIYKNEELIGGQKLFKNDVDCIKIDCYSMPFDEPTEEVTYKAELQVYWKDDNENFLRGLSDSSIVENVVGTGEEYVSEMLVDDPAYKKSTSGPIRVALIRNDPDVDYDYTSAGRDKDGNVDMHLKMSGRATLCDKHVCDRVQSFDAVLNQDGWGTIQYLRKPTAGEITVSDDKKTIKWNLNDDWCNSVPESVAQGNRDCMFDMKLEFYCSRCGRFHRLIVSSYDNAQYEKYKFYKKIPMVNVLWGCLAKGTLISMTDGTEKKIETINVGDTVLTTSGATRVTKVVSGTEQIIYRLKLETGEEVLATKTHPFLAESGMITVADITSSTKLQKKDGSYTRVLYCYPMSYGMEVYSLDIENGEGFFANGIVSGTHSNQGALNSKSNSSFLAKNPLLSAEILKMEKDFVEGRI